MYPATFLSNTLVGIICCKIFNFSSSAFLFLCLETLDIRCIRYLYNISDSGSGATLINRISLRNVQFQSQYFMLLIPFRIPYDCKLHVISNIDLRFSIGLCYVYIVQCIYRIRYMRFKTRSKRDLKL